MAIRTKSASVMIPTSLWWATTGTHPTFSSKMICAAPSAGSAGDTVSTFRVIRGHDVSNKEEAHGRIKRNDRAGEQGRSEAQAMLPNRGALFVARRAPL